jgi:hypothetical protein
VWANYVISEILAKVMKPFCDGEMIKECLEAVADVEHPAKEHVIYKISLSRFTIGKRIYKLSNNIEQSLKMKVANFHCFSVAKDKSNNMNITV